MFRSCPHPELPPGSLKHWQATSSYEPFSTASGPEKPPEANAQSPQHAQPTASAAAPADTARLNLGPDVLQAICLGVLGEHLEELLGDALFQSDIVPLLPQHIKACLLPVARLRRLLDDAALLLLADSGHTVLDLHGCGESVTDAGIAAALQHMPRLRLVDLRSCHVSGATLRTLGRCCQEVEVLRLGGVRTSNRSTASGLSDVLPALQQRGQDEAVLPESWDALVDLQGPQQLAAVGGGGGRLMQLQCVHWPEAPHSLQQHCRQQCPKVALNPSTQEVARRRLPAASSPSLEFDAELLQGVHGSSRWACSSQTEQQREPVVHIAEKFRLAYVERERRLKAQEARAQKQQMRQRWKQATASQRLIWDLEARDGEL